MNEDGGPGALTAEQQAQLHVLLIDEQKRLLGEIERLNEQAGTRANCTISDGGDAAELQATRHRAAALRDQQRKTLQAIESALARIDAGTYGYDVDTHEPIAFERLRLIPWARSTST